MNVPVIHNSETIRRLEPAKGPVNIVIDTDPQNEVDDQFALAYALLSPEAVRVEACYAAPFLNERSTGPADGMEQSYTEIQRVFEKFGIGSEGLVFKGSGSFLPAEDTYIRSEAAADLAARAMSAGDRPLYVVAIAALTNVASAILMQPEIINHIVVVWLGGQPYDWPTASEFNLKQDPAAARAVFDSGVPLIHIPCRNVAEHLRTTLPEVRDQVCGCGMIGSYLSSIFEAHLTEYEMLSKPIWDMCNIAYLINSDWVSTRLTPRPLLTDQLTWSFDFRRPLCRVAFHVNRDAVFRDFFNKLSGLKGSQKIAEHGSYPRFTGQGKTEYVK